MNPEFIDRMGWEMAEVYGAITDQILINLAKYFPYYKPGGTVPKSAFTYQAAMLAQVGQVNRETVGIIRNGLKNADSALQGVLEQAIIDSVSKAEKPLLKAVKMGIYSAPLVPVVSPNQMRAFQLYYKQAASRMNLVNTVMLESTESAYVQTVNDVVQQVQMAGRVAATQTALDIGAGETVTGVSSWNEAVRHSINRMKENGITGFVDHAGRNWSAEAYTAMDIRTTVANTARAAVWETNENFGNDLYVVSYHNGARPLCYEWQNKVISSTNNARDTVDLDGNTIHVYAQSDTTYGQAAGLFGINCKHYPTPFIPGVSVIEGKPQTPEQNAKTYEESQQQRALERKLREEKRDILMAKAQGAPPEEIKALQGKARQTSAEIQEFCDKTGRARHRDREGVYTERKFPDKNKYDVAQFERTQKEEMAQYYKAGGAQQQYKAGILEPKTPLVPKAETAAQEVAQAATTPKDKYTFADAVRTTEKDRVVDPGTSSAVTLAKADVYTMPDGTQFVFKSGMIKTQQSLTPEMLINRYYEVPKDLREKGQKVINVVDRYNPADAYWRKEYKRLGFTFNHSYATGGQQMTFWRWDYEHDMDYLMFTFEHEMGHLVDRSNANISQSAEWLEAIAKDKTLSGRDSWRPYGATRTKEDFADSVGYFVSQNAEFRKTFPNRTKILDRLLGGAQ